jgi:Cu(I)/Ag(I) efflux system periplasmic protein CusF
MISNQRKDTMKKILILAAFFAATHANAQTVTAEVKKIDMEAGKITLAHGPIKNLDMEGMTMVFRISPELSKNLKAGDKILIAADRVNGAITVTQVKKQ